MRDLHHTPVGVVATPVALVGRAATTVG